MCLQLLYKKCFGLHNCLSCQAPFLKCTCKATPVKYSSHNIVSSFENLYSWLELCGMQMPLSTQTSSKEREHWHWKSAPCLLFVTDSSFSLFFCILVRVWHWPMRLMLRRKLAQFPHVRVQSRLLKMKLFQFPHVRVQSRLLKRKLFSFRMCRFNPASGRVSWFTCGCAKKVVDHGFSWCFEGKSCLCIFLRQKYEAQQSIAHTIL